MPSLRGWGPSESSLLFIYGAFPFYPPGPRRASPFPGKKALAVPLWRAWRLLRGDVPTPAQALFLREIVDTLSASLPEQPYKFQIIVMDTPEVNAFAAPGGSIVVFRGLLEKVQTAEELAGILAHEMQHILHRHSTRMLLEHVSLGLLLGVIMGDANSAMKIGKEGAGLLGALHYGRQFEEQADAEGMRLILAAGIDPARNDFLFRKNPEGRRKNNRDSRLFFHPPQPGKPDRETENPSPENPGTRPSDLLPPTIGRKSREPAGRNPNNDPNGVTGKDGFV